MNRPQADATPGKTAIETAIERRLTNLDSGSYRRNNDYVLRDVFADWLEIYRGIEEIEEIDVLDCRRYAQWLRKCATADHAELEEKDESMVVDVSPRSASENGPYFTIVRAFLAWCVMDELLDTNPAKPNRVTDPLPEPTESADQQFWTPDHREAILQFVDQRAHDSLEEHSDRAVAFRDRAIVYLFALSAVRGAEAFRSTDDDARRGLYWSDIDLDTGLFEVYGKSREWQTAQLQPEVVDRLARHKKLQNPPNDDWPVFPTRHRPTLSNLDANESPPSITVRGARNLMQNICDEGDIDIDGEYLKLHGARRGLGHQLYEKGNAELAQDILRHKSVETTQEAYRDVDVQKRRKDVEDVLSTSEDGSE